MADLNEIAGKIMELDGVTGVLVATVDGQLILSQEVANPSDVASMMALCVINGEAVRQSIGFTRLNSIQLLTDNSDDFILMSLNKYIMGIRKAHKASTEEILKGFRNIFKSSS